MTSSTTQTSTYLDLVQIDELSLLKYDLSSLFSSLGLKIPGLIEPSEQASSPPETNLHPMAAVNIYQKKSIVKQRMSIIRSQLMNYKKLYGMNPSTPVAAMKKEKPTTEQFQQQINESTKTILKSLKENKRTKAQRENLTLTVDQVARNLTEYHVNRKFDFLEVAKQQEMFGTSAEVLLPLHQSIAERNMNLVNMLSNVVNHMRAHIVDRVKSTYFELFEMEGVDEETGENATFLTIANNHLSVDIIRRIDGSIGSVKINEMTSETTLPHDDEAADLTNTIKQGNIELFQRKLISTLKRFTTDQQVENIKELHNTIETSFKSMVAQIQQQQGPGAEHQLIHLGMLGYVLKKSEGLFLVYYRTINPQASLQQTFEAQATIEEFSKAETGFSYVLVLDSPVCVPLFVAEHLSSFSKTQQTTTATSPSSFLSATVNTRDVSSFSSARNENQDGDMEENETENEGIELIDLIQQYYQLSSSTTFSLEDSRYTFNLVNSSQSLMRTNSVVIHRIFFAELHHLPSILHTLRQQLLINELLQSCMGSASTIPTQAKLSPNHQVEVTYMPPDSVVLRAQDSKKQLVSIEIQVQANLCSVTIHRAKRVPDERLNAQATKIFQASGYSLPILVHFVVGDTDE